MTLWSICVSLKSEHLMNVKNFKKIEKYILDFDDNKSGHYFFEKFKDRAIFKDNLILFFGKFLLALLSLTCCKNIGMKYS